MGLTASAATRSPKAKAASRSRTARRPEAVGIGGAELGIQAVEGLLDAAYGVALEFVMGVGELGCEVGVVLAVAAKVAAEGGWAHPGWGAIRTSWVAE